MTKFGPKKFNNLNLLLIWACYMLKEILYRLKIEDMSPLEVIAYVQIALNFGKN